MNDTFGFLLQLPIMAPWFGEIGLGTQYLLPESVWSLIDCVHLKEVKTGRSCG
jgi:hypothetical protein